MNIKYVIPSYKRASGLKTPYWVKKSKIYVSKEDYENYIKGNENLEDRLVVVPDGVQGNGKGICINWILDNEWDEKTDAIIMMDDDIEGIYWFNSNGKDRKLEEDDFYELCEKHTLLAKELGVGCWCFGTGGTDRLLHESFTPFNLKKVGTDQFMCYVENDGIRYDERFLTSEGFDYQLQSIQKYKRIFRDNRYYVIHMQWKNKGGYQDIRIDGDMTDVKYRNLMRKKWGRIIQVSKKQKEGKIKCGYTIKVPIKGV